MPVRRRWPHDDGTIADEHAEARSRLHLWVRLPERVLDGDAVLQSVNQRVLALALAVAPPDESGGSGDAGERTGDGDGGA